eukprot:COSAG02_NODE_1526_length_12092_cov_10.672392_1_plen_130_part_00
MSKAAENDPELRTLDAASESMQAIIDSYAKANFLDENGLTHTSNPTSKEEVLQAVTQRYGAINKIAHAAYDTVVAALQKKKYTPVGAAYRAPRWTTDMQEFHLQRIRARKKPGFDPRRWNRKKKKRYAS